MNSLGVMRGIGATAVAVLLLASSAHAEQNGLSTPPPSLPVRSGTGAITGSVVDSVTGLPLVDATVRLEERKTGFRSVPHVQVTTPKGRFAFVDLPAADNYVLTVSKDGYLDGGFGRSDPRGPSAPITLADGEWMQSVVLSMSKPGSLSGTVLDERGQPVVGVFVRALPQLKLAGTLQAVAGPGTWTDDRGMYRISGLGPGSYLVSAPSVQSTVPAGASVRAPGAFANSSSRDALVSRAVASAEKLYVDVGDGRQALVGPYAVPPAPSGDGTRRVYPVAFYPDVATVAEAAPVELRLGQDRVGIDLTLRPVRSTAVSGLLQGPPDAIRNQVLRLIPAGLEQMGQGSEAAVAVTQTDGRFSFVDVPAGSYTLELRHALVELMLMATSDGISTPPTPIPFPTRQSAGFSVKGAPHGMQGTSLTDSQAPYWATIKLDVDGVDRADVVLPLQRPLTVSGRIAWAPGSTPMDIGLTLEPAGAERSLGFPTAYLTTFSDGSPFAITGAVAGQYVLRARGATVEAVQWDGRDYLERPFDTSRGDVSGIVITLSNRVSVITGSVMDGSAPPKAPAAVIAFPVDRDLWTNYGFNPTRFATAVTTASGQFRLEGLPAGEYCVVAVPAAQERGWLDPEFLARHLRDATRVSAESTATPVSGVSLRLIK